MIKKVLVCGRQVYFTSVAPDTHLEQGKSIEVEMPVEEYWRARDHIDRAQYLQAAGESATEVMVVYKKVFRICSKHAIEEKNRLWLQSKSND